MNCVCVCVGGGGGGSRGEGGLDSIKADEPWGALGNIKADELWGGGAFGTGGNFRFLAIHPSVVTAVGPQGKKIFNLPIFHASTGCNNVSFLAGLGTKTAWSTWNAYPKGTKAFEELVHLVDPISDKSMEMTAYL